jgi:hypothetical protein
VGTVFIAATSGGRDPIPDRIAGTFEDVRYEINQIKAEYIFEPIYHTTSVCLTHKKASTPIRFFINR